MRFYEIYRQNKYLSGLVMSNASFTKLSVSFDSLVYKKNKDHRSIIRKAQRTYP